MSTLHIAPHLQRALETMSKDLAIDPQALVNQALFAWLRINGYVLPGAAAQVTTNPELAAVPPAASDASLPIPPHVSRASPVPLASIPAPATGSMPAQRLPEPAPAAPVAVAPVVPVAPVVSPSPVPAPAPAPVAPVVSSSSSSSRAVPPVAAVAPVAAAVDPAAPHVVRMKEIAVDLEKLTQPWPDWIADAPSEAPDEEEDEDEQDEDESAADDTPEPAAREEDDELPPDEEPPPDEEEDAPAAAAGPIPNAPGEDPFEATSIRSSVQEERVDENTGENDLAPPREEELDEGPPPESTVVLRSVPIVLYLEREGEEPIRIQNERFIIGRGPTCDLIIDSPRVSREHVVLTREGVRYFIEDLNSSNGTWLGAERLTKREIESGDLISLGNEPVTFILRGE